MGEETQDLKLQAKAVGFDQAAKEVDKVSDAQKGLTDKVDASSGAKDAATKATDKLKASESDLTSLLSQINPQLGAFADALFKGGKIAGDLASQQISLGGAMAKATGFIKANAGALKLLAASGAVVIGIMAIVRAIGAVREEADRATEAIKRQQDALNDIRQQRE